MQERLTLPTPVKKPPSGGALDVCTYQILNSLLEIPMAVTCVRRPERFRRVGRERRPDRGRSVNWVVDGTGADSHGPRWADSLP
jgi:hypothetical protein